jgi:ribosomal protein S6--L-glutamate ligase
VHITVLSRSPSIYTTRRLAQAARARGHRVRVLNPVEVEMGLGGKRAGLYHKRKPLARTDVVIPRIALSINQYGLAVVNQLDLAGLPVLNGAQGIATSRNMMRCLQLLAANGIGVPHTIMANDASDLRAMVDLVGGVPVLVKLLSATEKTGVMICETPQSLEAALEAIIGLGQNIIIQQYVRGHGRDLRVLVVGGKVVAALQRRPQVGRFSRTLARGAQFEPAQLPEDDARAAIETARVVGLEVCAVEMLDTGVGPKVFEVNSSPGIREAEDICGVDVAEAIIIRAEELARRSGRTPARPRTRTRKAGRRPSTIDH